MIIEFKEVSILSCNIRGANNPDAGRHIRDLIQRVHPTILIVMETNIRSAALRAFGPEWGILRLQWWNHKDMQEVFGSFTNRTVISLL